MKWMALAVGLAGTIVGAITAHLESGNFFHGVNAGSPDWTITMVSIGALAAILSVWKAKWAGWVLLAISVGGVFGNFIMWEGPGTFYLASALICFTNAGQQSKAKVMS